MAKTVLIPIPSKGFDPSEVAIPWKVLTSNGHRVHFSTPDGRSGRCDPIMLTGKGLGPLAAILAAEVSARKLYQELENSAEFKAPEVWQNLKCERFDGILLPGGHESGMKTYLESTVLQGLVRDFFLANKPVGAICHGVVLAARSRFENGKSVLYGKKTTALLQSQEWLAWILTFAWLGRYYRTYPQTVESEVRSSLASNFDFIRGKLPLFRDSPDRMNRGFCVRDGNYLSARWPGDAYNFATTFSKMLQET